MVHDTRSHWLIRFFNNTPVTATICTLALLVGVGYGSWAIAVATSGVAGSAQITRDQNSAANREAVSNALNGEYQQLVADQEQLVIYRAIKNPNAEQTTNLTGAQLNCTEDVALYNASAASLLVAPFVKYTGYPPRVAGSACDPDAVKLTDLG